ncbi:MAG TPA: family 78 glycoside hydrolase catalytic domain [Armatimonadota bacterium]|jgi:hypothetical protein
MKTLNIASALAALSVTTGAATAAAPMSRGAWIWSPGPENPRNLHAYFRKTFTLSAPPSSAIVRVTADNRYVLYVNGQRVSRGPARSHTRWMAYETLDIAKYLTAGTNALTAVVAHYGEPTFRTQNARAGFLLEADIRDGARTVEVQTDQTWKCLPSEAWARDVDKMSLQLAFPDVFDARKEPVGWREVAFDDSSWKPPTVIGPAGTAPWTDLAPSGLPPQIEEPLRPAAVVDVLAVKVPPPAAQIDMASFFDRKGWAVAYASTCLYVPTARTVTLEMGCDDAAKVWLDGGLVLERIDGGPAAAAQAVTEVKLKAGWHRVMVKVVQVVGQWKLFFGVSGPGAKGIVLSSEKDAAKPGSWRISPLYEFDAAKGLRPGYDHAFPPETGGVTPEWTLTQAPITTIRSIATIMRTEPVLGNGTSLVENSASLATETPEATFQCRAGKDGAVLLDMGREVLGYPRVTIRGAQGGEIVDMGYGEGLVGPDGAYVSPRNGAKGRLNPEYKDVAYADRFICRRGDNTFEPTDKRAFRYWQIEIRNAAKPVTLAEATVGLATYPVAYRGAFECSDPILNRIWNMGRWTLQLNMDDAYTDCPWRERAQWWGDARVESLVNYYCFGDTALMRRALVQAAQSQDAEGIVRGVFPTDWDGARLPSFSLMWVYSLWEYYLFTGDSSLFASMTPVIDRLMGFFQARMSDEGGLLKDVPYWVFIDWAPGMEVQRFGVSGPLNCLYYRALLATSDIARVSGDPDKASRYAAKAAAVKAAINNLLWAPDERVYMGAIDKGKRIGPPSQHMSSLAVAFGIAPRERAADTMRRADTDPLSVKIGSPYFSSFYLDALYAMGRHSDALAYIRKNWGGMLDWGATTFWEKWEPTDSLCHGWSACPTKDLPAQYLGVRPTSPGWAEWEIAPAFCDLQWAKGVVPTVKGDIKASWKRQERGVALTLTVPGGTTGRIVLPRKEWESASWRVNGKSLISSSAKLSKVDASWVLTLAQPGDYDVEVTGGPS